MFCLETAGENERMNDGAAVSSSYIYLTWKLRTPDTAISRRAYDTEYPQ